MAYQGEFAVKLSNCLLDAHVYIHRPGFLSTLAQESFCSGQLSVLRWIIVQIVQNKKSECPSLNGMSFLNPLSTPRFRDHGGRETGKNVKVRMRGGCCKMLSFRNGSAIALMNS